MKLKAGKIRNDKDQKRDVKEKKQKRVSRTKEEKLAGKS
jgi:hypothetical protein